MEFLELKDHIKKNKYYFSYYLHGDDFNLILKSKKIFKDIIYNFKDVNIININDEENLNLYNILNVLPLNNDFKLIFIENITNKNNIDILNKYLSNPVKYNILVFCNNYPFKKIHKNTQEVICNKLSNEILETLIIKNVIMTNTKIEKAAIKTLIEFCSGELTRIETELDKLIAFKIKNIITKKDVEYFVFPNFEYKIYELCDNITNNKNKSIFILKDMLNSKIDPLSILGLVYAYFRKLLYVKLAPTNDNLNTLLKVKPYAVKYLINSSNYYKKSDLLKIIYILYDADRSIKVDKLDSNAVVLNVILQIIELNRKSI